jgi:chromosome partitioning protein
MGRVYAVVNRKGGQGKSTTVSTLARLCAIQGARVLVVDLAQPGTSTTSFRDLWPEADHDDLSHCLLALRGVPASCTPAPDDARGALKACGLPIRLRSQPSWGAGHIDVLPHDDLLGEAATLLQSEQVLAGLVAAQRDEIDITIVDCPTDGGLLLANALAASHRAIMPLVPEAPALEGADATLRALARVRQSGHAITLGGVLLTRCDPKSKRATDVVRTLTLSGEVEGEALQSKLFPFAVRQSEYFEQAFRYGVPVWERTKDPSHWAGYALLAAWALADAGLAHLAAQPRLEARLEPTTRILYSPAIGLGKPEIDFLDFQRAHAMLSA